MRRFKSCRLRTLLSCLQLSRIRPGDPLAGTEVTRAWWWRWRWWCGQQAGHLPPSFFTLYKLFIKPWRPGEASQAGVEEEKGRREAAEVLGSGSGRAVPLVVVVHQRGPRCANLACQRTTCLLIRFFLTQEKNIMHGSFIGSCPTPVQEPPRQRREHT